MLSDAELKTIWAACAGDDYGAVLRLLMLTGQRAQEIGSLRWGEVHDDQIVLPAERTKKQPGAYCPTQRARQGDRGGI